jgi:hypothetical protein
LKENAVTTKEAHMAVIWGRKKVERKLGFVAEFCPICRTPREFEVSRVGIARVISISFRLEREIWQVMLDVVSNVGQ